MCTSDIFFDKNTDIETWAHHLPHWEQEGKLQFVTFRLADSLPQSKLQELAALKQEFERLHPHPWTAETAKQYRSLCGSNIEKWLDQGFGSCVLGNPEVRKKVEAAIDFVSHTRCLVLAYVIMPNHVHILLVADRDSCSKVIGSVRQNSAREINKILGRRGILWEREPYDRLVRNDKHLHNCLQYIHNNPRHLPSGSYTLGGSLKLR